MGRKKLKRRDRPVSPTKSVDPGLQAAVRMAAYQYERECEARQIIAVSKEVAKLQKSYTMSVENWFYGLLALALHDEGWGAKRILRVLDRIRDYHDEYNSPDFGDFDLWDVVREEVNLDFDPGTAEVARWQAIKARREQEAQEAVSAVASVSSIPSVSAVEGV